MAKDLGRTVVVRQIWHVCPYKGQSVPIALCYLKAQDVRERDLCYACPQIDALKMRWGLRTFRRKVRHATCAHCGESASLHDADGKGLRVTTCPGFLAAPDSGKVYVPTNQACTEWMVMDVATGERRAYIDHRATWDETAKRFHLPLLGAPGTVPPDPRDVERLEAAAYADRQRAVAERRQGRVEDENGETKQTKLRIKRRKKTT